MLVLCFCVSYTGPIKLPFVIKICDLSIFEWLLKTGFTVFYAIMGTC